MAQNGTVWVMVQTCVHSLTAREYLLGGYLLPNVCSPCLLRKNAFLLAVRPLVHPLSCALLQSGLNKRKKAKACKEVTNVWYHGCKSAQTPNDKVICCRESVK